ncbi:MAG: cupin domain-containing protein [Rhodospirillaceae bacterium]|nr:cupin domain-containing protein [Rhodospirillaceae bacterium]MDD9928344.1 cupin domain-containing protein [Rhodospirillaceae bacterium]
MPFQSRELSDAVDAIAPDGSEIRFLGETDRASMVHCTLPPGGVSKAVRHKSIEEIWHFLSGEGEVWRAFDGEEEVKPVTQGTSLTIPTGAHFQFRNTGPSPLRFVIATMPPWPGEQEAERVPDRWPTA